MKFIEQVVLRYFNYSLGLLVLLLIIIISPFRFVRLHPVAANRLGHFTANIEIFLCELKDKKNIITKNDKIIFFYMPNIHGNKICNNQIDRMWQRTIKIRHEFPFYYTYKIITKLQSYIKGIHKFVAQPIGHSVDPFHLIEKYPPSLSFTLEEEAHGKKELMKLGIPTDAKFVCLTVRDNAYLDKEMPTLSWDYHNYRNLDIENFIEAAQYLETKKIYVLRMGKHVESKLDIDSKFIIDYANSSIRSDFMDVYLGAMCEFCITTQTGYDGIPHIFRKPLATITMPLGDGRVSYSKSLFITKHHICSSTKKELKFKEIFERGLGFSRQLSDYENRNVILKDPTPGEIKHMVSEMLDLINSNNGFKKTKSEDQIKCNNLIKYYLDLYDKKNKYGEVRSRFSQQFLKNNPNLLA